MIHRNYSDLKLFKWLRRKIFRIEKPYFLPFSRWETWNRRMPREHPIGWLITEQIPRAMECVVGFFVDPLITLKQKYVMRYVTRPHLINTGLSCSREHDFKIKFLHGLFSELTYYVEVVLANRWTVWSVPLQEKYGYPKWRRHWWARWRQWRCAEAGLDGIRWQINTDLLPGMVTTGTRSESAAEKAREVIILYSWWVHIRPQRRTSWAEAGLEAFWAELDNKYGLSWVRGMWSAEDEQLHHALLIEQDRIEAQRAEEDQKMMIRLIKLAPSLVY